MVALSAESVVAPLFGRYHLLRRIGTGRVAVVFLALDVQTGRRVALKLITSRRLDAPGGLARLAEAARAWSALRHPNLVALLEHGPALPDDLPDVGPRYYLALDYVPGRSLAWHAQTRGPLPIEWSARIVREVLAGLHALHEAGLVHLDLRPENVLLGADGTVRLTDPLIAGVLGYSTPDYLSPEQVRDEPPTPASDLYAAGVLLYDLLADGPPFRGGTARRVLSQHVAETAVSPRARRPAVPEDLARVSLRAMEKQPERRYRDARELSSAVAGCLPSLPWQTPRRSGWGPQVVLADSEVAPVPRRLKPQPRIRVDWRRIGSLTVAVASLLAALALGVGWQLFPTPLTLDQQESVRSSQPTPTRTAVPTPVEPVIIVYVPLFATPSAATATPTPTATISPTASTPVLAQATPGPRGTCSAPPNSNPAIAEAFEALVYYSCGTPLEQTVASSIAIAVERGTEVRFELPTSAAWGYFDAAENRITLAPSVAMEPAEARAALLIHELTHVRDYYTGGLQRTSGVLGCYDVELRAFQAEAAFWRLVRAAGVTVHGPIADDLDSISRQLAKDSSEFVMRELVARYGTVCSP